MIRHNRMPCSGIFLWILIWVTLITTSGWSVQNNNIKAATWNLQWFPDGTMELQPAAVQQKRIQAAARLINETQPDILILQEVRNTNALGILREQLKPLKYHLEVVSRFQSPFGEFGQQQNAILSRIPAQSAWYEEWKTVGATDPPRGFVFSWFKINQKDVGVFGVHLKSNMLIKNNPKESHVNRLKRELAMQQLLLYCRHLEDKTKEKFEAWIVAGDFNTNEDDPQFAQEQTLKWLQQAGFHSGYESIPLHKRITCPGKGRYTDATFDYIWVWGAKAEPPQILKTSIYDHHLVTRIVRLPFLD